MVSLQRRRTSRPRTEYLCNTLLSAPSQADTIKRIEPLILAQLAEIQALRTLFLNVIIAPASGEEVTPPRIVTMRDHADAIKMERARVLLLAAKGGRIPPIWPCQKV